MTIEQRIGDAISDLQSLLSEGREIESAIQEIGSEYDLKVEALEDRAIKVLGPLEDVFPKAKYERFYAAASVEIEECKKNRWKHSAANAFDTDGRVLNIAEYLASSLGRKLSDHEIWKIGEMLDPSGTEIRMSKLRTNKEDRKSTRLNSSH